MRAFRPEPPQVRRVFLGEDFPTMARNQVTNLRKKIESSPSQPRYLSSVRGIGYRFDG